MACGYDEDDDDPACARRVRAQCGKELSDKDVATKLCSNDVALLKSIEPQARALAVDGATAPPLELHVEACVKTMQKEAQGIYEANK